MKYFSHLETSETLNFYFKPKKNFLHLAKRLFGLLLSNPEKGEKPVFPKQ